MRYDMTARALVLEQKDCETCVYGAGERGQYTGRKVCEVCGGTGHGPRGGVGKCRGCSGFGHQPDFDNPVPCPACGGDWQGTALESFCDTAPDAAVLAMPVRIARLDRRNTFNENFIGMGCLWSTTDYGTAAAMTDDDLLEAVRTELTHHRVQAVKILRPYQRGATVALLHDTLVIAVTRDGYSVRALSDLKES